MWKLVLHILGEVVVGLSIAGLVLSLGVPALVRTGLIEPGHFAGMLIIACTVVLCIVLMLVRPGSALHRRNR